MADFTEMISTNDIIDKETRIINSLAESTSNVYVSFIPDGIDGKKRMFNMLSAEGTPMIEMKDKEITMFDCAVMPVKVIGDDGEEDIVPRICIEGENGKIYTACSWGLYNSINRVRSIFDTLHFEEGLKVKVKVVKTKKGKTINLEVI